MKLWYEVISHTPNLKVKFFYEGPDEKYGEFYINFARETQYFTYPNDAIGIRGQAEVVMKDKDYAVDLLQGLAEALGGDLNFAGFVGSMGGGETHE